MHAQIAVTCSPRDRQIQTTLTPTYLMHLTAQEPGAQPAMTLHMEWAERMTECRCSHRWFLQMTTFIATRKAAQVKEGQLTFLSCWTPPNILITPSISCSSLLAQYCILQEMERKRERERERKREKESESWHWVDKQGTEGRGRKSVPQLSSLLSLCRTKCRAEYQEHTTLRITAGSGYKLQDFKIYAQGTTERRGEKEAQKNPTRLEALFSAYINICSR